MTTPINTTSPSAVGYTTSGGVAVAASGTNNIGNAVKTGAFVDTSTNGYVSLVLSGLTTTSTYRFSELDFTARATSTGPTSLQVFASTDGGATFASASTPKTEPVTSAYTVQLNALTLNVSGTSGVEFRVYGFGGAGSAGNGTENLRTDDYAVAFDTVAAPEPTSLLLLAATAAPLALGRRRRGRTGTLPA